MMDTDSNAGRLALEFAGQYMEKLFYFCMKKTGSNEEAEDLTQDIALNILSALNQGTEPENFPAWVWRIARNRYAVWAKQRHRRIQSVTGADIGDCEIEDEGKDILDEMICSEQLSIVRRELAFIRSDYRDLVVAYYLENRSMRDIAAKLSFSLETVKKRIQRARVLLKEGMEMAREFGTRSYQPEQIRYSVEGNFGKSGQPWSIINHLLYKNIFLELYENPETAEELSLELGMALPYMEDELEYLVREELLRKVGDRYETNFLIISRREQRKRYEENRAVQKKLTETMCEMLDLYRKEGGAKADVSYVGYDAAKWALLARTFYCLSQDVRRKQPHPSRPDDGAWTLTGYEIIDWKEPAAVGCHGCISYDEEDEIDFGQFKFYTNGYDKKMPEFLTHSEGYTLWLVCVGEMGSAEEKEMKRLLAYGYLKKDGSIIRPNLVIFDRSAEEKYSAETAFKLSALKASACDLIRRTPDISCGYCIDQALEDGWLKYNENMISTIGAYIYL